MTRALPRRAAIWALVGAGLLVVLGANAHLVVVAVSSQPACVDHVRPGDAAAARGAFSAANSACAPSRGALQPH
jgi:hypothetical protein